MSSLNPLAVRMNDYELEINPVLPRKTWAAIRLDGKAFHTYTRGLERPFDKKFLADMSSTMEYLCAEVDGVQFGYTQSDEISLILTDTLSENAQLWFGGRVQKIVSVAASLAGAAFNRFRSDNPKLAAFDARVFALPSEKEAENYLRWRQIDGRRNALFMAASEFHSHKELHGRSAHEKIAMLKEAGHPWGTYPERIKYGSVAYKIYKREDVSYTRKDTGATESTEAIRTYWKTADAKDFLTQDLATFFRP